MAMILFPPPFDNRMAETHMAVGGGENVTLGLRGAIPTAQDYSFVAKYSLAEFKFCRVSVWLIRCFCLFIFLGGLIPDPKTKNVGWAMPTTNIIVGNAHPTTTPIFDLQ